jgi:hypothetical protein
MHVPEINTPNIQDFQGDLKCRPTISPSKRRPRRPTFPMFPDVLIQPSCHSLGLRWRTESGIELSALQLEKRDLASSSDHFRICESRIFSLKQVPFELKLHRKWGCPTCILSTILWFYDHARVSQSLSAVEPERLKLGLNPNGRPRAYWRCVGDRWSFFIYWRDCSRLKWFSDMVDVLNRIHAKKPSGGWVSWGM